MNCEQVLEQMSAMLDGALSPEQTQTMQEHLDTCPECRRLLQTLEALDRQVSSLQEPAPEGLKKGILYRIDQATGKTKTAKYRRFGPGAALGAIAAVLVLLVGTNVIPINNINGTFANIQSDKSSDSAKANSAALMNSLAENDAFKSATGILDRADKNSYSNAECIEMEPELSSQLTTSSSHDSEQNAAIPVDDATRTICTTLCGNENAMVLVYSEFDYESFSTLLEREEPKLYALLAQAEHMEQDGQLCCKTTCGTALAIHEWLLENLPQSDQTDPEIRETERAVLLYLNDLDPDSGSLRRIITWESSAKSISWPTNWAEDWALRLRTEENWALFFPKEGYAPSAEKTAYLVFPLNLTPGG